MRYAGESPAFRDQIVTMCLDCQPENRVRIIEDKNILVVDDFITQGFTTEWARHLLLNAGAKSVISVAIGAFHDAIEVQSIAGNLKWDSFKPVDIEDKYIRSREFSANKNQKAVETIIASYKDLVAL
jgi:phosphoribosylpyrophosphate synthetase